MNKTQLENQAKGLRPALHMQAPDTETLQGLMERAADSLKDAKNNTSSVATLGGHASSAKSIRLRRCGWCVRGTVGSRDPWCAGFTRGCTARVSAGEIEKLALRLGPPHGAAGGIQTHPVRRWPPKTERRTQESLVGRGGVAPSLRFPSSSKKSA